MLSLDLVIFYFWWNALVELERSDNELAKPLLLHLMLSKSAKFKQCHSHCCYYNALTTAALGLCCGFLRQGPCSVIFGPAVPGELPRW